MTKYTWIYNFQTLSLHSKHCKDEKLYHKLTKKIEDINKLKKLQANGVSLQRNQLAKIATEINIVNQLNDLEI